MSKQTWWQARKQNKLTQELVDLKRQEINMQQTRTKAPDRRCPDCGRIIPFDAKICPYCCKKFEEF